MKLPQNQKPGTVFVFEEVGAFGGGASAREWQSQANKFFFSFMQTSRHRNQIVIMNCPNFSFLESGARSLVHLQMEMKRIEKVNGLSFAKPFRVQVNSRTGQFYFKYLRATWKGSRYKVQEISFKIPTEEIVNEYEDLKSKYTAQLNDAIINSEKPEKENPTRKVNLLRLQELFEQGLTGKEIAERLEVSERTIIRHKKLLKQPKIAKNPSKKALLGDMTPFKLPFNLISKDKLGSGMADGVRKHELD